MLIEETKMRRFLGVVGFGLGFVGLAAVAGSITEAGPDLGLTEALNLLGLMLVSSCMLNLSTSMLTDV